jgi:hypothetical protein
MDYAAEGRAGLQAGSGSGGGCMAAPGSGKGFGFGPLAPAKRVGLGASLFEPSTAQPIHEPMRKPLWLHGSFVTAVPGMRVACTPRCIPSIATRNSRPEPTSLDAALHGLTDMFRVAKDLVAE